MSAKVLLCLVWLCLLAGPSEARQADEQLPPRFDVERHCRSVANVTGTYSAMIDRSCFEMEQTAYNALKSIWTSLAAPTRRYCTQVATVTGPGSYSILGSCINMEEAASRDNDVRKFDY